MTKYVLNHNVISAEKLTSENIFPEFNTDLNKCVGLTVFKQHTFFFFGTYIVGIYLELALKEIIGG